MAWSRSSFREMPRRPDILCCRLLKVLWAVPQCTFVQKEVWVFSRRSFVRLSFGRRKGSTNRVSSTCCSSVSGDGARLCLRGVGRLQWDWTQFIQVFWSFGSLNLGDAANTFSDAVL